MKRLMRIITFVLLFSLIYTSVNAQGIGPAENPGSGEAKFVPGQVLLLFRPGTTQQRADGILAEQRLTRLRRIPVLGVDVVKLPSGLGVERAVDVLSRNPNVVFAEPNYIYTAQATPIDDEEQWGLDMIQAPLAWEQIPDPEPVILATVDTGIDRTHPDISANIWENEAEKNGQPGFDDDGNKFDDDVWGWDFVNNDNDPSDDHMHGTLVSSVSAAVKGNGGVVGVCPWCKLMAVKVLGGDGSGSLDVVADGITYAADNGARVINLSLAGIIGASTLEIAVNHAWDQGSLVVAAAGNNGNNTLVYPAAYANAMSVGSTNSQDFRSCFSNYGENYISVAAPGEAVIGAVPGGGYGTYSGTSLAAPHVTGLGGLLFSQNPARTNSEVRTLIESTTNDMGPEGPDAYFGTGRINADRAVRGETFSTPPPTGLFSSDASASGYAHARKLVRDSDGGLHLVWHTKNGNQFQVIYATSSGEGEPWVHEVVFESPSETFHPSLAFDGNRLYLAFPSKHESNLYRIYTTSKTLTDESWTAPLVAISGNYNAVRPDLYYDQGSSVLHLVASSYDDASSVYYTSSQDGGSSWSTVDVVSVDTGAGELSRYVDVHANGPNLYLAGRSVELMWFFGMPLPIGYRVFFVQSMDGGDSWSAPQVLAQFGDLLTGGYEYGLSLSGFGDTLSLAYEDAGNIRFRSKELGLNWSAAELIGAGAWPSITLAENGEMWAAWDNAGDINLRHYNGSAWETAESKGAGSYPNLRADNSGGTLDWVTTQCSGAPFRLTVSSQNLGSNQPPVADSGGPYTGEEDVAISFDGTASTDPDGDPLSYAWDFGDGSTAVGVTASHIYAYGGTFTVSLTVSDGRGGSDTVTTTATISESNDLPVADAGGPYSGEVGSPVAFDGSGSYDPDNLDGTLANDQTLSYTWNFGDGGTGEGELPSHTYTAGGEYIVSLTVSDGVDTDVTTAQVVVTLTNQPPVANNDSGTIAEGGTLNVPAPGLLANDSDPEGGPLTVITTPVTPPTNGDLTLNDDGSYTYAHDGSETTSDSFAYQVCDPEPLCATATVDLTITGVNDPPVAVDDSWTLAEGGSLSVGAPGLLANDSDPEGGPLTVTPTPVTDPTHGSLTLNGDGSYTYTHDGSETTSDSFVYQVCDPEPLCDTATVYLTIMEVNDPPAAGDDSAEVVQGGALFVESPGLLANDGDPEGDPLAVTTTPLTPPAYGELTLFDNGSFAYVHDGSETTSDSFEYEVCDSGGLCDSAMVDITVTPAVSVHVGDLDAVSLSDRRYWVAQVIVTVHDPDENLVSGASVLGTWEGGLNGNDNCTTTELGQCSMWRYMIRKNVSSISFTVTNVAYIPNPYQPGDNHDPDDDSDGTYIVIPKP